MTFRSVADHVAFYHYNGYVGPVFWLAANRWKAICEDQAAEGVTREQAVQKAYAKAIAWAAPATE